MHCPPSASIAKGSGSFRGSWVETRSAKRVKVEHRLTDEFDEPLQRIPHHPLRIKPFGNAFIASHNIKTSCGLFGTLPDELLILILEYLDALSLVRLGATCKAFFAFSTTEELWKPLFVELCPKGFHWRGSWRSTYLSLPVSFEARISCTNLYSDVLYRPFFCAHTPIRPYAANIPPQNKIPRFSDLTDEEYSANWTDKPFILTSPVKKWPIFQSWATHNLIEKHGDVSFRAEAVDWELRTYFDYMNNNYDESPLYLFDSRFAEKMGVTVGKGKPGAAYWPPPCFGEDLFNVLEDQRPDRRWLIIGPERSGSTFHKDPNATSAWNAVITGSKYWLMFPSSPSLPPPPGVFLSPDQSEITSPLSIAEYLLSFHAEARRTPGCREGICSAGEVLHVPSGWFHLVLNLEESVALTQNFVPKKRLGDVLHFLKEMPDQVSGFKLDVTDPYGLFVEILEKTHPDLLTEGLKRMKEIKKEKIMRSVRWEKLVQDSELSATKTSCFSFDFRSDEEEEEVTHS